MGELQTTRGQETGDETNSEQTRHGATEAVTRTTNSKGSEYGAGAMNCSRPGWLILLHRMPWTQGNWLPCPWQRPRTRGSTPGSGCGRCARRHYQTLLSVLIHLQCLEPSLYRRFTPPNRHDSASPGRDSGQGNQKAAGRLAAWGSNTHQRLATCEPLRAPILDWGPKPSFRPCDSGSCSQLSLSCMASCRSRKTVRVAESGIENGPGKHGRTRPHSSIIQRRQNITAIPSPVPDPIPMPNSNFARLPQRSLPRPWKSNGTVVSPSARLLVSWSTRLHVFSRRLLVYHWLQCDGGDLVWMGRLLFTGAVLAAPRCCVAWGWGLGNVTWFSALTSFSDLH